MTGGQATAFEPWWKEWRKKNGYSNTKRMRDAARVVHAELQYEAENRRLAAAFRVQMGFDPVKAFSKKGKK